MISLNYSNTSVTQILLNAHVISVIQGTPPACINLDSAPTAFQVARDTAISIASATAIRAQ